MRVENDKILEALPKLHVDLLRGVSLAELTSLGIGGTTDLLRINRHDSIPDLAESSRRRRGPPQFPRGGSNLLGDGWRASLRRSAIGPAESRRRDRRRRCQRRCRRRSRQNVTLCAKNNLGGMEGLIGVPGTVGGALRMNAGAYGIQIGSYVR